MATQIHGAGPAGQRSPGLDLAIAGYLTENPPAGTGGSGVTATDAPTAPAEGASASYLVTSAVTWPAGLVWSTDPDGGTAPTITDAALVSLFTVDGTTYAVLGSTYPVPVAPDETGPTAGTLGVVLTSTTADGTVTGAADETELHATPYSFRVDAGTWSAWQAGATYEWTGLTASTEYDFQHRVRDAAGNITEGTVVTDTTDAPSGDTTDPTPGTLAASAITSESFTLTVTGASDETELHSQPYAFSTDNGATWSAWQAGATFNATGLDPETEYTCQHKVRDAALNEATGASIAVETEAASGGTVTDTFTREDGAIGTTETGQTWTTAGGDGAWSVVSNAAKMTAGTTTTYVTVDTGMTDMVVEATISNIKMSSPYAYPSIMGRFVDADNFYRLANGHNSANKSIIMCSGGTSQNIKTGLAISDGDALRLELVEEGSATRIRIYANDVEVYTTAWSESGRPNGTRAGLMAASPQTETFDNFEVTAAV